MIYGKSELAGLNERVHNLSIESFRLMCAAHQAGAPRRNLVSCVIFGRRKTSAVAARRSSHILAFGILFALDGYRAGERYKELGEFALDRFQLRRMQRPSAKRSP
jgi:hypothetical protein